MANESTNNSNVRREAARADAKKRREAELRRASQKRTGLIAGIVVLVLVIGGGIGFGIWRANKPAGPVAAPKGIDQSQAYLPIGATSGKPVVDIYLDYMCPVCGQFEEINGDDLAKLAKADDVSLRYHPRTFLDSLSTEGDYSSRAANAAACVYSAAPDKYLKFTQLMFKDQPKENGPGLTDAKIAEIAKQAGAGDISSCQSSKKYEGWVNKVETEAKSRTEGTPAIFINGKKWGEGQSPEWATPGALNKAIKAAKAA